MVLMETAGGDEETVTLTESPASLGVFRGEILVRKAAVKRGDGILQAQDGQNILARTWMPTMASATPANGARRSPWPTTSRRRFWMSRPRSAA